MTNLVNKLLCAIDKWCVADEKAADFGMTKEIGYEWDDARDKMLSCADEVRLQLKNMKDGKQKSVVIVTIHETLAIHEDEVNTMVFDSMEKAETWVERQIDEKVIDFHLDRDSDVDGWFVKIDGWNHTIQYDAKEKVVN